METGVGKLLVVAGTALIFAGAVLLLLNRLHLPLGRLPGDISWRGKNTTIYFPWVTCLVLSVIGSMVLWWLNRRH